MPTDQPPIDPLYATVRARREARREAVRFGPTVSAGPATGALDPKTCRRCAVTFVPRTKSAKFCGDACALAHYLETFAQHSLPAGSPVPGDVASIPSPDLGPLLPGALMGVVVEDFDPSAHRTLPSLMHWVGTVLSGRSHAPRRPTFAMWPEGPGWCLWLPDDARVVEIAGRAHRMTVADGHHNVRRGGPKPERIVRVGPPKVLEAPAPLVPGRYRTHILARSPIHSRADGVFALDTAMRRDSRDLVSGTLAACMMERLGRPQVVPEMLALEVTDANIERIVLTNFAQKIRDERHGGGVVQAWRGAMTVETNALGAWLLAVAGLVGLGAKTAYGCGRVRIETARVS